MCFFKAQAGVSGCSVSFNAQPPEQGCDGLRHSTRDVPASQAGTSRKGDQPTNWRATDPSTSGHQPQKLGQTADIFLTLAVSSSSCKSGPSCCPRWRAGLLYAHVELEVVRRTSTGMSTTFALCSCLGSTLPAPAHSLPLCDLDGALRTTCCATQLRTCKSG